MTYYTDKEVLRKALTALESCSGAPHWEDLQPAVTAIKQALAAQPAVPDAITDNSESPEYRTGWNDYRAAMMEMMK
jgi:hypothetical protein